VTIVVCRYASLGLCDDHIWNVEVVGCQYWTVLLCVICRVLVSDSNFSSFGLFQD
jgi:hypothetical protein